MTEVEVVTLEDGKDYTVVKEKQLDGITYLYLVSDDEEDAIRKVEAINGIDMIVTLDTDEEFDKVAEAFRD